MGGGRRFRRTARGNRPGRMGGGLAVTVTVTVVVVVEEEEEVVGVTVWFHESKKC